MTSRKEYKILSILLNVILWIIVGMLIYYFTLSPHPLEGKIRAIKIMLVLLGVYYLNYYYILPKYLFKRRFVAYGAVLCLMLLLVYAFNYGVESELYHRFYLQQYQHSQADLLHQHPPRTAFFINFGTILMSIVSIAVSTSIRGTQAWFKKENELKEIENKKLSAELSYLKAQINPHFFFNTLNGIYALARKKSDQTPEVIMMLSTMMRYIIYEASAPQVKLKKELEHIANFLEMQKLRLSDSVKINFNVLGSPANLMIEPLLFSALVENAFKHGIDNTQKSSIEVKMQIQPDEIHFYVFNPMVAKKSQDGSEDDGIGIHNVKKRLDLLYPGRHTIEVIEEDTQYKVELILTIGEKKQS